MDTENKAACIRKVLEKYGSTTSLKEVRKHLESEHGITVVSAQQVSNERTKLSKRRPASPPFRLDDLPVSVLKKVKGLVDELGSTDALRRALDELDALTAPARITADSGSSGGDSSDGRSSGSADP